MIKTKKELKEDYKQSEKSMGVFRIKNSTNNKVLIDHSLDINAKWNRHRTELKFGSHRNRELQKDWIELGEDKFTFEILSTLKESKEENINYNKELKILQNMVVEELNNTSSY
jgi:hypothetical protein